MTISNEEIERFAGASARPIGLQKGLAGNRKQTFHTRSLRPKKRQAATTCSGLRTRGRSRRWSLITIRAGASRKTRSSKKRMYCMEDGEERTMPMSPSKRVGVA